MRTFSRSRLPPLLLLGLLLRPAAARAGAGDEFANKRITVPVDKVVDGDTLEIASGERVRLLHINTPETGEAGGAEATALSRRWVQGKRVEMRFGPVPRDHYGRYLAEIWVGGKSLNEELVRRGWAHAFFIPPVDPGAYRRIVAAQVEAREAGRGIWAADPRYRGVFHITSFHHDADGDDRTNLNGEYVRIANISTRPESLQRYRLENRLGQGGVLPKVVLPVGRTVTVHIGSGRRQLRAKKGQQEVFLGRKTPLFHNSGDLAVLRAPDGKVADQVRSKKKRFFGRKKKAAGKR